MISPEKEKALSGMMTNSNFMLALIVIGILVVMMIPLPFIMLDLLMAISLALGLVILLLVIYTSSPLEFSSFPTLLLLITLFKLSLNVASTRLILLHGNNFDGKIIKTFGDFVVGGNYVIGLVIFVILVIIQFMVITKGSGRIAEVAARFTLDAMPGKQMAIDADLNAGIIDEMEATKRREEIRQEADFYGAMDGASKFVRGDTIAGIIITVVNIVGGLIIGIVQMNMPAQEAAQVFTLLTIGDGLVSQIPSIMISSAAGIIVTRAGSGGKAGVGSSLFGEMLAQPKAIMVTGGVLLGFALLPGLPKIPLFIMAALVGLYGRNLQIMFNEAELQQIEDVKEEEVKKSHAPEPVEELLQIDPMELEIGYGLISLVDSSQGGDLLDRITMVRRQCVSEMGIIIPPIRIRDNMHLEPNVYVVKLRGVEIASGTVMPDYYLAMNPESPDQLIPGIETVEPSFGLPAVWITENQRLRAESSGYTVVNVVSVMSTHLMEVIKSFAHEILGRQDVRNLLDNLKKTYPALVDEVVPALVSVGGIQKVLQNLLKERIPVRDLVTILEVIGDYGARTKDTDILTEYVRHALARTICKLYQDHTGQIKAITLDPQLEEQINSSVRKSGDVSYVALEPLQIQRILEKTSNVVAESSADGIAPVVLCSPQVRMHFKRLIERGLPAISVLSYNEIESSVQLHSVGMVEAI